MSGRQPKDKRRHGLSLSPAESAVQHNLSRGEHVCSRSGCQPTSHGEETEAAAHYGAAANRVTTSTAIEMVRIGRARPSEVSSRAFWTAARAMSDDVTQKDPDSGAACRARVERQRSESTSVGASNPASPRSCHHWKGKTTWTGIVDSGNRHSFDLCCGREVLVCISDSDCEFGRETIGIAKTAECLALVAFEDGHFDLAVFPDTM